MTHEKWINTILKSYVKKHSPEEAEVHHLKDFLTANPAFKVSSRLSYLAVKEKAEKWVKKINEKNKNLKESGRVEIAFDFKKGMKLVRLANQTAKDWEGKHMGHCVASYREHEGIYSIRDEFNIPCCTIEIKRGTAVQIKGKANQSVAFKYHPFVLKALQVLECKLSAMDLKNIGYHQIANPSLKYLKINFTGLMDVEVEGKTYINYSSPLKLKKSLTQFNEEVFQLLLHSLNCPEALVQLAKLKEENLEIRDKQIVHWVRNCSRVEVTKPLLELLSKPQSVLLKNFSILTKAAEASDVNLLKYVYGKFKNVFKEHELGQRLIQNTINHALGTTYQNRNLDTTLFLLKAGAIASPNQVRDFFAWAIDGNSEEFWNYLLPLNEIINDEDYDAVMEAALVKKNITAVSTLVRARSPNSVMRQRLIIASTHNPLLVKLLLEKFVTDSLSESQLIHSIISETPGRFPSIALKTLSQENINLNKEEYLATALRKENWNALVYLIEEIFSSDTVLKTITNEDFNKVVDMFLNIPKPAQEKIKVIAKNSNFTLKSIKNSYNSSYTFEDEEYWEQVDYEDVLMPDGRIVRHRHDYGWYEDRLRDVIDKIQHEAAMGFTPSPKLYQKRQFYTDKLNKVRRAYRDDDNF